MTQSNKVENFVDEIIEASGWASDDYVVQFAPSDFTDQDITEALKQLAQKGALYREGEETLEAMNNNEIPAVTAQISVQELEQRLTAVADRKF